MAVKKNDIRVAGSHRVYELYAELDGDREKLLFEFPVSPMGNMMCVNSIRWFPINALTNRPYTRKGGFQLSGTAQTDLDICIWATLGDLATTNLDDYGTCPPSHLLIFINGHDAYDISTSPSEGCPNTPYDLKQFPLTYSPSAPRLGQMEVGRVSTGLSLTMLGNLPDFQLGEMFYLHVAAGETLPQAMRESVTRVNIVALRPEFYPAKWIVNAGDGNVIVKKEGVAAGCAAGGLPTARLEIDIQSSIG